MRNLRIGNSLVREQILRLSEIFEGKPPAQCVLYQRIPSTRWVLYIRIHLELRPLKERMFFLDGMIMIMDDGLFRKEELVQVVYVLWSINWLLMLLSTQMCIISTEVSGVSMLLVRLKVVMINTSQNRMMHIGYLCR
jgi:hypothetical protein